MFIDEDHPDFKKYIVVCAWTNQIIPNVKWVNITLGLCEIHIQDPDGVFIIQNDEPLAAIIRGDFKLKPIKED